MESPPPDPKLTTKPAARRSRTQSVVPHYCGPAVITDGITEETHEIEIHMTRAENAALPAWHAIIKGRLVHDLRFPSGKPVAVHLPAGGRGAGTLVDPQLIRGEGDPPC